MRSNGLHFRTLNWFKIATSSLEDNPLRIVVLERGNVEARQKHFGGISIRDTCGCLWLIVQLLKNLLQRIQ